MPLHSPDQTCNSRARAERISIVVCSIQIVSQFPSSRSAIVNNIRELYSTAPQSFCLISLTLDSGCYCCLARWIFLPNIPRELASIRNLLSKIETQKLKRLKEGWNGVGRRRPEYHDEGPGTHLGSLPFDTYTFKSYTNRSIRKMIHIYIYIQRERDPCRTITFAFNSLSFSALRGRAASLCISDTVSTSCCAAVATQRR